MKANLLQQRKVTDRATSALEGTRLAFVSLGCAKALVDSERVIGSLLEDGMVLTDDYGAAEVIVVNTCGFLESAEEESMEKIREATEHKKNGNCRFVIALGCLAERRGKKIREKIPAVDAVVGAKKRERLNTTVRSLLSGVDRDEMVLTGGDEKCNRDVGRYRLTKKHFGYVKIGEGCDNTCTFCVIPDIRGGLRSKSLDDLQAEARELAADGVREINVIGQDTSDYGRDLYGERRLGDALKTMADVDGIRWVRLLYAYPGHLQDNALDVMADHPNVVPYIDMPIQHINQRILKRMARGTKTEEVYEILENLRHRIPDITIRTTLIVGFPGETEAEFQELKDFVREQEFDRLGVFEYSDEEGSPAEQLDGKVPREEIRRRWDEIMDLQKEIAFEKAREKVGKNTEVLLERDGDNDNGTMVGRSKWDAPEQDPVTFVENTNGHEPGDLVPVEVTAAQGYDLRSQIRR